MDDDLTFCEVCGRCDREDRLMLCDGCDFGYHMECLDPPLETVPIEEWFCPECSAAAAASTQVEVRSRRITQPAAGHSRVIARTGAFEIVRSRILARRTNSSPSTRAPKTKKRRKKSGKTKKRRTRGRKKRTQKSRLSTKRLPPSSRKRIANVLGLCNFPKSPFGLPDMRLANGIFGGGSGAGSSGCSGRSGGRSSSDKRSGGSGIRGLSMFGQELDFYEPRSYEEAFEFGTSDGGTMGIISRQSVPSFSKGILSMDSLPSQNLLADILTSQEMLHAVESDLDVARDGRVYVNTNKHSLTGVRRCADSNSNGTSPGSSSSSAQNDNSNNSATNSRMSNGKTQSSYNTQTNSGAALPSSGAEDISLIKPVPSVFNTLHPPNDDNRLDMELYSDIESLTGDKEDDEKAAKEQKNSNKPNEVDLNGDNNNNSDDCNGEPVEEKSNKSKEDEKRPPTVADLFGEDTDDEDGLEDIKKLVQRQGSISVHYPIKMSIKLKSNQMNDGKMLDEMPIMKKWVPIHPENGNNSATSSKSNGPKWKVIGKDDEANETTSDEKKLVTIPVMETEAPNEDENNITSDNDARSDTSNKDMNTDEEEIFPEVSMTLTKEEENFSFMDSNIKVCKHGKVHKKDKSGSESLRRSSSIETLFQRSGSENSLQLVKGIVVLFCTYF